MVPNAITALEQSLSKDPKSSQTHFLLGYAFDVIKDYSNAEKYYKTAIELFPEFAEAYFGLGNVCYQQKKFDESYSFVKKSLELNPNFPPAIQLMMKLKSYK
jgi:Tfp pilus assembly protein PilF